jgi:hypothetical protein
MIKLIKLYIIQIILISIFLLYGNNNDSTKDEKILEKNSDYYNFLSNIVHYNNITRESVENGYIINNELFLKENEYFYIFYNKNNLYVYFFQNKLTKEHVIYFNGFNNLKDIDMIYHFITNSITPNYIEGILNKCGNYYEVINDTVVQINNDYNIFNIFDNLYKNKYTVDKNKISVNGYSLGGIFSQVFVDIIYSKNIYTDLNIQMYNIESWFLSNKNPKSNKICTIFSERSILYFYNNLFQRENKCDYLLKSENNSLKKYIKKYVFKSAPFGIINYIKDHHFLSNIINEK